MFYQLFVYIYIVIQLFTINCQEIINSRRWMYAGVRCKSHHHDHDNHDTCYAQFDQFDWSGGTPAQPASKLRILAESTRHTRPLHQVLNRSEDSDKPCIACNDRGGRRGEHRGVHHSPHKSLWLWTLLIWSEKQKMLFVAVLSFVAKTWFIFIILVTEL